MCENEHKDDKVTYRSADGKISGCQNESDQHGLLF